jgi:hypothetical protein
MGGFQGFGPSKMAKASIENCLSLQGGDGGKILSLMRLLHTCLLAWWWDLLSPWWDLVDVGLEAQVAQYSKYKGATIRIEKLEMLHLHP